MGSPLQIIFYSDDSVKAEKISRHCYHLADSLVYIYSDYLSSSELNQLCATAGNGMSFQCSPELFDILKISEKAFITSERTFDITLGPITHLWRQFRKEKEFPDSTSVSEKLKLVGFKKLLLDTINRTATLTQKGMELDLGGIAQGYIAQKIVELLKRNKIENALVDVSGDIVCIGKPPGKSGWAIAVNVPGDEHELLSRQLVLTNCAVTTSGDVYQFIEHNGKKYSHLIDPKTGYGITSQSNVTVIAKDGTQADWLTKACSILPIKKAMKLARELNASLLIVEIKKGRLVIHSSKNFNHFWKKNSNE